MATLVDDGEWTQGQAHVERNTRSRKSAQICRDLDLDEFADAHIDMGRVAHRRFYL
jgi:hypothetical protein